MRKEERGKKGRWCEGNRRGTVRKERGEKQEYGGKKCEEIKGRKMERRDAEV